LIDFSPSQKNIIKIPLVNAMDGVFDNFLWLLEEAEDLELVAHQDGKTLPLKNVSDGLPVDCWNLVDYFSEYKMLEDILDSNDTGLDSFLKKRKLDKSEESEV